jgi:hypothetical protein
MDYHLSPAETAKRFGVSIKALRLYERHGLLEPLRGRSSSMVWRKEASDLGMSGEDLEAYYGAVHAASPWNTALRPIVDEAAELVREMTHPSAPPAQALVGRLRTICADYALGAPLVYVRCAGAGQFKRPAEDVVRTRVGWAFLAKAIVATETQ